jgi:hypothetical protein
MKKLYVIVRKDLSTSQQAVQAGHAVAAFLLHGPHLWKNETLIYLGAKDYSHIQRIIIRLILDEVNFIAFKEPDLNNEVTAIASEVDCELFNRLKLL